MTTAVADSTVLVFLAKLGDLSLLRELFDTVLVPGAVQTETVERGRAEGYSDALAIDEATETYLEVACLADVDAAEPADLQASAGLGRGEAEAITLARAVDGRCLTDDHAARTTARSLNVPVGGTIYVLLQAVAADLLSVEEYIDRLDALVDGEFRMSGSLYRRAVEAGKSLDEDRHT